MVRRLPALKPKIVIRALERSGFYVHHTTGSHYILKKGSLRVTVAYHGKDLKPRTLASIIEQAGLTVEAVFGLALSDGCDDKWKYRFKRIPQRLLR